MARRPRSERRHLSRPHGFPLWLWDKSGSLLVNLLALFLLVAYLFPISYMIVTSLKDDAQFPDAKAPIWPAQRVTFNYGGTNYPLYEVPTEEGVQQWALVTRRRYESEFIDPANPEAGLILWEGQWRSLEPVYRFFLDFENFTALWEAVDFPRLMRNTMAVAVLGGSGALLSSISVAYGFSRFRIPGGKVLFILLIATIVIPEKVTLIPTYFIFVRALDWTGTWYPLIVPHLFGNAILIFLLRQNFKSIPREMEEAAMLDGAGPLRTLVSVILPQCPHAIVTAALLHFFYAWNEVRTASLYLGASPALHTVAFGMQQYQGFVAIPNRLQASALITMAVPVLILFLAQRVFMREVLITGLEK